MEAQLWCDATHTAFIYSDKWEYDFPRAFCIVLEIARDFFK